MISPSVKPFNEQKYKALMDGLEAVEVRMSALELTRRIDSEYYKKIFLKYDRLLCNNKYHRLDEISKFLIGPFGSAFTVDNYTDDTTYRYIRGKDVKPFILQDNDNVFMPESDYQRLKKYALMQNDILISVVGTLGNSAIINAENLPAIFSCKSTVIRDSAINPFFLLTYLNTTIIKNILLRKTRGAIQLGLNLDDLKTILVVDFSELFHSKIEFIYKESRKQLETSKSLYTSAEELLLSHLGFADYKPSKEPVAIKSFSSSFGTTGRLDSEYYQLKYEEIEKCILCGDTVKTVCILHDANFAPEKKQEYQYIELSNIGKSGKIIDVKTICSEKLPSRARRKVKKGQVIVSSIEGSLDSCALISDEFDGALCSTGFYVIEANEINAETLLVLFKSMPIQSLLKRSCSGTILTAINKEAFLSIPLPQINVSVQTQITKKVQEAFALRKKSIELLDLAKTAVELAIEQGEEKAMELLGGGELE